MPDFNPLCRAAGEERGTRKLNTRYQAYQRLACLRRSGRTRSKAEQTPTLREFAKSTNNAITGDPIERASSATGEEHRHRQSGNFLVPTAQKNARKSNTAADTDETVITMGLMAPRSTSLRPHLERSSPANANGAMKSAS